MLPAGGLVPATSIGHSLSTFFDAVGKFLSNLAHVNFLALLIACAAFTVYLTLRARASFHILRAAYPDSRIRFRQIWGAYFAGYGFNSVIPARSGDVIRQDGLPVFSSRARSSSSTRASRMSTCETA